MKKRKTATGRMARQPQQWACDLNGIPTDPAHHWNDETFTTETWLDDRLAWKERAYKCGKLGALRDVIKLCGEHYKPLPVWATQALLAEGKQTTGTGRHARWQKQHFDDMKDVERYYTVQECREHGIPWTDDKVYKAAMLMLEGTYAGASHHAIREAYKRVKARMRTQPGRYHALLTLQINLKTAIISKARLAENMAKVKTMSKHPEKLG